MITDDTIVALSSGTGGAIAVIRMSGEQCAEICDRVVRSAKGRSVANSKGYTMLYGDVVEADGSVIDDAVVAIYKAPHSYTGEDMVEHGGHGGLELGVFCDKMPGMDIVTLGCKGGGAHTVTEWLDMDSYGRVYEFMKKLIAKLAEE